MLPLSGDNIFFDKQQFGFYSILFRRDKACAVSTYSLSDSPHNFSNESWHFENPQE